MTRTRSLTMVAAFGGALLLVGCERAPTGPAPVAALPPALGEQTSNVGEIVFPAVFGIFDEENQLLVVFGLPDDPLQWEGCGGTVPGELLTVKVAGLKSGVLKVLSTQADAGVQVFQASGEREGEFGLESVAPFVCETSPIAVGTGHVIFSGNDLGGNGGGTEVINITLTGTVTDLATGGLLHVTAANRFMADHRDGGFTLLSLDGRVNLHPIGGD